MIVSVTILGSGNNRNMISYLLVYPTKVIVDHDSCKTILGYIEKATIHVAANLALRAVTAINMA